MFFGEYTHSLDSKARLMIPAKHREGLAPKVVVTRCPTQPCLWMFPIARWLRLADQLDQRPMIDEKASLLRRVLFTGAEDLDLDGQGRILISQRLRDYAQIGTDVFIAGMYTYLELWQPALWQDKVQNKLGELDADLFSAFNL